MIKTLLHIEGMMCHKCEAHMNEAIESAFSVKKVSSSHTDKLTEILSEAPLDEAQLKAVVADTGYTLLGIESAPVEKKGFHLFK